MYMYIQLAYSRYVGQISGRLSACQEQHVITYNEHNTGIIYLPQNSPVSEWQI